MRSFRAPRQAERGARFVAVLAPELLRRRPLGILAHMCPIYAILASPLARPLGVPVVLWFTHWRARRKLAVAERLATRVLTVDAQSFPLRSARRPSCNSQTVPVTTNPKRNPFILSKFR